MNRFNFFLAIVLFFILSNVFGQTVDKPPLSFGVQSAITNADLSTGALQVSIPIDNSVIPIVLSYSTTGIRANQIPGNYGLGWNCSVDNFIAREILGLPDDSNEGYCGKNKRGLSVNANLSYDNANMFFYNALWDTEPDIFSYQFLGYSGWFILDPNRNVIKLTHDNVKITVNLYYSPLFRPPEGIS